MNKKIGFLLIMFFTFLSIGVFAQNKITAEEIIKSSIKEGDTINVGFDAKKDDISITISKARKKPTKKKNDKKS